MTSAVDAGAFWLAVKVALAVGDQIITGDAFLLARNRVTPLVSAVLHAFYRAAGFRTVVIRSAEDLYSGGRWG